MVGKCAAVLLDVRVPMFQPVACRRGDVIVVRRCAPIPVAVVRLVDGEWVMVREGPADYAALLSLLSSGAISARSPESAALLAA